MLLNTTYNRLLSRIFSHNVYQNIAKEGYSDYISELWRNNYLDQFCTESQTYFDLFESVYRYLIKNYKCEYIYKNALVHKILLGRHSLNTSCVLEELRVGNTKADIVILNGTSTVYEIKSEFDSLTKLYFQISQYQKFFDNINIVTHELFLPKIINSIPDEIGIIILNDRYSFSTIREPISNKNNVVPEVIFDTFRKKEYCDILRCELGELPKIPNTQLFNFGKKHFMQLHPAQAHEYMLHALTKRSRSLIDKKIVSAIPHSLTLNSFTSRLSDREKEILINFLGTEIV